MALDTIGTQKRTKPRLAVLRGWDINNPSNIAPRAVSAEDQGTILSGHVISKDGNDKWILGAPGAGKESTVCLAIQDDVDFDVVGSGVVTGISVLGKYEVQTAFFDSGDYTPGTPVTYSAGTAGNIAQAAAGDTVIGYVTGGKVNIAATNSNVEATEVVQFATQFGVVVPA